MASMWFDPGILVDSLAEVVGYKAGVALSFEEMCEMLSTSEHIKTLTESEIAMVRLRAESFAGLIYELFHKVGYTTDVFNGDLTGIHLYHKYKATYGEEGYLRVVELFVDHWPKLIKQAEASGTYTIDPTPFIDACAQELGQAGIEMAVAKIKSIHTGQLLNPFSGLRFTKWKNIEQLNTLFTGSDNCPDYGKFIDQRFLNYLHANPDKIKKIHWRKFEEFTAEYFDRAGFAVELGPGQNDNGVDLRIWQQASDQGNTPPLYIIQCKRQKKKIDKVTIKGLYADTIFEGAQHGLLVTSSELSVGAKTTIQMRGYPIQEINFTKLKEWLLHLHKPGTGIVRV